MVKSEDMYLICIHLCIMGWYIAQQAHQSDAPVAIMIYVM